MNLRDDLHRVADGAHLEALGMAGIRARAQSIRRRRRYVAVGGAAVGVAAVATGAVLLMPGSGDRTNPLPSTRSPSPTTSPVYPPTSSSPATPARRIEVNLANSPAELTYGGTITVPNWINGQLTDAHGNAAAIASPVHRAWQGTSGDWYGMTFAQGEWTWTWWGVQGNKLGGWPAPSDRVAVTPDGSKAAVMLVDGGSPEIDVFTVGQQSPRTIPLSLPAGEPQNGAGVDGILPNGDIIFEGEPGDVRIAHADGTLTKLADNYATVAAVTPSGTIVAQKIQPTPLGINCYDIVTESDHTSGNGCFRADEGLSLSADGQLMLAAGRNGDGSIGASVGPAPSSTETQPGPSAQLTFPKGTVLDTGDGAWVGDSYVVPVWSNGSWQLVWLSKDGYKITRSLSTKGDSATSPYLLGAGPLLAQNR